MLLFPTLDLVAFAWFCGVWLAYSAILEWTDYGAQSLNSQANRFRSAWIEEVSTRDVRIADTQIMASLHSGAAFFASASLIGLGGVLNVFGPSSELLNTLASLPFGTHTTPQQWEAKIIGLVIIFAYAFLKFAWSYRLFIYAAIMMGAMPPANKQGTPRAQDYTDRTAQLAQEAACHFNRGQRALIFALGYLGWFVHPVLFIAMTITVAIAQWRREFTSSSSRIIKKQVLPQKT
jgi:uncharacterized membrane protein